MNILVIKQTSLGDVLHATGHIRAIKQHYPASHLTVLTADTSAAIYRGNPHIDEIIEFQRYRVKDRWWRQPLWSIAHVRDILRIVRSRHYDLAIDLQGRWKSVLFLYGAHADRRYVKGNWPFLGGFRDKRLHALDEMDRVLDSAGIPAADTRMEIFVNDRAVGRADTRLREAGWRGDAFLVVSPFTRWPSKNWSPSRFASLLGALNGHRAVVVTGAAADAERVDELIRASGARHVMNLCGALELDEFAAVVKRAAVMVSGDSFAMHLAVACETPVVALFGPTDERRVGPRSDDSVVLRADVDCRRCYQRACPRRCIDAISEQDVLAALASLSSPGGSTSPA